MASLIVGLLIGALLTKLAPLLLQPGLPTPCTDVYKAAWRPVVYNVEDLYQGDYGRDGLAHITVAGAVHHGLRKTEVWLQTFAPGVRTPVHRHDCEELFVIQRGGGTAFFRADDGSRQQVVFRQNDTLFIPPNMVHQIVNTGQEDMQALVVFHSPPIQIWTYASWTLGDEQAQLQRPYYWDRSCPPRVPEPLHRLQRLQQQPAGAADREL